MVTTQKILLGEEITVYVYQSIRKAYEETSFHSTLGYKLIRN